MDNSKLPQKEDSTVSTEDQKEFSEELDEDSFKCGYGSWKPSWLQGCNSPRWLLACVCWFTFTQGFVVNGVIFVNLSAWERLYELSSTQTAWIVSVYDISAAIFTLIFGYIGRFTHNGIILSIGSFVMALGSFLMVTPHLLSGPYELGPLPAESCDISGNSTSEYCVDSKSSIYYWLLILGQLFHGVGGASVYTLGIPYMDGQIKIKNTPVYIGIMMGFACLGPAMGYICGGLFLQIYVDFNRIEEEIDLEPSDPRWVGAWWLGLLYSGFAALTVAALMACFPKELPSAIKYKADRVSQAHKGGTSTLYSNEKLLKDIWLMTKSTFTNPVWVFITISAIIEAGAISGFAAYLPKILQFQFSLTATEAAIYAGLVVIPGAAGGTIIGGLIPKCLNLKMRGLITQALINTFICMLLSFQFILRCPTQEIAGVTVPYFNSSYDLDDPDLYHECNSHCNCTTTGYDPVCGSDGIDYFTPCFAGCTEETEIDEVKVFYSCSCIRPESSLTADTEATLSTASETGSWAHEGICEAEECNQFYVFLVLFLAINLCTFITSTAIQASTIRAVKDEERSFAYGLQVTLARVFGSIPAPLVYGLLFDVSCLVWQESCGAQGSCWIYDTTFVAYALFYASIVVKGVASLGFLMALLVYKPPSTEEHLIEKEIDISNSDMEIDDEKGDDMNGSIQAPLVYGLLFDVSCLVWQESCGAQGSCWIYDTTFVAYALFYASIVVKGVASLGFLMALLVYKPPSTEEHLIEKEIDISNSDMEIGDEKGDDMDGSDGCSDTIDTTVQNKS